MLKTKEERVRQKVDDLIDMFLEHMQSTGRRDMLSYKPPEVLFDLKGNSINGQFVSYDYAMTELHFHPDKLHKEFDHYINTTIPHEVAHYCAYIWKGVVYNRSGRRIIHGDTWKYIMRLFGVKPSRCNSYQTVTTKGRKKRFTYKCECRTYELTSIRHNRVKKGRHYVCRDCHERLQEVTI